MCSNITEGCLWQAHYHQIALVGLHDLRMTLDILKSSRITTKIVMRKAHPHEDWKPLAWSSIKGSCELSLPYLLRLNNVDTAKDLCKSGGFQIHIWKQLYSPTLQRRVQIKVEFYLSQTFIKLLHIVEKMQYSGYTFLNTKTLFNEFFEPTCFQLLKLFLTLAYECLFVLQVYSLKNGRDA